MVLKTVMTISTFFLYFLLKCQQFYYHCFCTMNANTVNRQIIVQNYQENSFDLTDALKDLREPRVDFWKVPEDRFSVSSTSKAPQQMLSNEPQPCPPARSGSQPWGDFSLGALGVVPALYMCFFYIL